jgi:hypothetical protein
MARTAKNRSKAKKSKKRAVKRAKTRSNKSASKVRRKARAPKRPRAAPKSQRRQQEPIPADPAGRIGLTRPSNEPKAPGLREPQEIAKTEPDARFDDRRQPDRSAREIAGGDNRPAAEDGYKNTDERF